MKLARMVGMLALITLLGTACQTLTGQTAGGWVDDKTITAQVKSRLAATEAETLTRIDVDTVNGTVYLKGTVADAPLKARAEEIARTQEGVKKVVNNLQVSRVLSR